MFVLGSVHPIGSFRELVDSPTARQAAGNTTTAQGSMFRDQPTQSGDHSMALQLITAKVDSHIAVTSKDELISTMQQEEHAPGMPSPTVPAAPASSQHMPDAEVDALAVQIDEQCLALQKGVLEYFIGMKGQLLSSQAAAVDMERKLAATKLAAKQAEVQSLQEQLGSASSRLDKLEVITDRCVGAYWDSGSRARATKHLVHAWVLWRQAVKAARQLRHKMAIAERWHARVALQRNVLAAWRRRCLANQRELAQKRADAQVAAARAELGADKDAEIAAIRQQLEEARAQLLVEGAAREQLEEDMRRAFMRGVCALNIEAMAVMKRGAMGSISPAAVPFGTMPFPDQLGGTTASRPLSASLSPTIQQQEQQQALPQQQQQQQPAFRAASAAAAAMYMPGQPGSGRTTPQAQLHFTPEVTPSSTPQPTPTTAALQAAAAAAAAEAAPGSVQPAAIEEVAVQAGQGSLHPVMGSTGSSRAAQQGQGSAAAWGAPAAVAIRPRVVVERGPRSSGGAAAGDAPRPRTAAPAPHAQPHYQRR